MLVSEDDKSDFPAGQILLVPNVLVGRQQKLKACGLGDRYQFAIDYLSQPRSIASTTKWPFRA